MHLSILVAFLALLGVSSGDSTPKTVVGVADNYQVRNNLEQWDVLKTKQQRLRTGYKIVEELMQKRIDKLGPDPAFKAHRALMVAVENAMNYRPADPAVQDAVDHMPVEKTKTPAAASTTYASASQPASYAEPTYAGYQPTSAGYQPKSAYESGLQAGYAIQNAGYATPTSYQKKQNSYGSAPLVIY